MESINIYSKIETGLTDIENKLVGERNGKDKIGYRIKIQATMYKMNAQQRLLYIREL